MADLPQDVREYLAMIIEDDVERKRDHIAWLSDHPQEPDLKQQIAECERAIALGTPAREIFPLPADAAA